MLEAYERAGAGVKAKLVIDSMQAFLKGREAFRNVMPWFAQGVDAADGVLSLAEVTVAPRPASSIWPGTIEESEKVIDAIVNMHKRLSKATGGFPVVPPTWTLLKDLVTPHPLGGCNMGTTPANGVVDHKGEVFGYETCTWPTARSSRRRSA